MLRHNVGEDEVERRKNCPLCGSTKHTQSHILHAECRLIKQAWDPMYEEIWGEQPPPFPETKVWIQILQPIKDCENLLARIDLEKRALVAMTIIAFGQDVCKTVITKEILEAKDNKTNKNNEPIKQRKNVSLDTFVGILKKSYIWHCIPSAAYCPLQDT